MDDLVERILGHSGEEDPEEIARVRGHVAGLVGPDERFVAGIDNTWRSTGKNGTVLTDRRVFRYRNDRVRDVADLREVERIRFRRMWYPGAGFAGRGEAWGHGPVVILRLRFELVAGRRARLRLQDFAGVLRPFVAGLVASAGRDRVDVARTLPGL